MVQQVTYSTSCSDACSRHNSILNCAVTYVHRKSSVLTVINLLILQYCMDISCWQGDWKCQRPEEKNDNNIYRRYPTRSIGLNCTEEFPIKDTYFMYFRYHTVVQLPLEQIKQLSHRVKIYYLHKRTIKNVFYTVRKASRWEKRALYCWIYSSDIVKGNKNSKKPNGPQNRTV